MESPDPDDAGNRTPIIATYGYNIFGEVVQVSQSGSANSVQATQQVAYEFDDNGNLSRVLPNNDPQFATEYSYDPLNRLVTEENALGHQTLYTFDASSRLATLTDANDNTTSFIYDLLGRLASETNELNKTRSYVYDTNDNLLSKTDRNGRVTEYQYDSFNRPVAELWKNGGSTVRTISTTYDLLDNVTGVTDPDTNATFEYDGLNRLKRENYAAIGGAAAYAIVHTLDPLDRRTKRQVFLNGSGTANTTNDYTYDAFGRMTSVSQSGSGVAAKRVNIGYDNLGLVVSESSFNNTSGTGSPVVATTKQYDGLGRTSQIKQMSGANTLVQFDYTYDALGRLASETSNNGTTLTTSYTYDQVSQLIAANRSDSVNESYAWDPVGNPVGTGYVIGANNRLLEDPQFVYSYDDEGNRTGKTPKAGGSATTYNWDYRNRLTGVSGGTSSVEKYDAFDRRTISTSGGSSDFYLWDGSHIALEMSSTTTVKTRPLHGPAVDQVFAEEGSGSTRWMLTDIRGSVRGVTNNTGTVQNRITYDSFGAVTNESNPSATDTLFGYTGREFDTGVGMQNNRARWYDASARRWASEDPIGFAAGDANVFRYVSNTPINALDPSGLIQIVPFESSPNPQQPKTPNTNYGSPFTLSSVHNYIQWLVNNAVKPNPAFVEHSVLNRSFPPQQFIPLSESEKARLSELLYEHYFGKKHECIDEDKGYTQADLVIGPMDKRTRDNSKLPANVIPENDVIPKSQTDAKTTMGSHEPITFRGSHIDKNNIPKSLSSLKYDKDKGWYLQGRFHIYHRSFQWWHAWIEYRNIDTGEIYTLGRYGTEVPTGVIVNRDLDESKKRSGTFPTTGYWINPSIFGGSGYNAYTDSCHDYATEAIDYYKKHETNPLRFRRFGDPKVPVK